PAASLRRFADSTPGRSFTPARAPPEPTFAGVTVACRAGLFQDFTDRWMIPIDRSRSSHRDAAPPRIQRTAIASKLHAHAAGEFDPIGKATVRDRDHDGNVGLQRALDQIGQAFSLTLPLAEAVDDQEVGSRVERVRDASACVLEPAD